MKESVLKIALAFVAVAALLLLLLHVDAVVTVAAVLVAKQKCDGGFRNNVSLLSATIETMTQQ